MYGGPMTMNPLPSILALLVSLGLGFGSGYTVQGWKRDAADKQRIEREAKKKDEQIETAQEASAVVEKIRTVNEIRYRTVTVTLEKIVDRPVYLNQCIDDDGLRILNDQISGNPNPGKLGLKLSGS